VLVLSVCPLATEQRGNVFPDLRFGLGPGELATLPKDSNSRFRLDTDMIIHR
jgi:hypothetical protein